MNSGNTRCKLKDANAQGGSKQELTLDERDSRDIVRGWEQCCPIDKWKIAFPNGPPEPPLGEQGWEMVEGKRTKVGYFLKLRNPRPYCYDIVQRHSDEVKRRRVLMDIEEDDDEGREGTMDEAQSTVLNTFAEKTKVSLTLVEQAMSGMGCETDDPPSINQTSSAHQECVLV